MIREEEAITRLNPLGNKKVVLFVPPLCKISYNSPHYKYKNASYHENWYIISYTEQDNGLYL